MVSIDCSSGTYIRSFAKDLAKRLTDITRNPVKAMIWDLLRSESNGFKYEDSKTIS